MFVRKRYLPKNISKFFILTICALFLIPYSFAAESGRILKVRFFDVGYGDSILLEVDDSFKVLIDAGPKESGEYLLNSLLALGIKQIDIAILTHPHKNHFEGFINLLTKIEIKKFYINDDEKNREEGYKDLVEQLKKQEIPIKVLKAKDRISFGSEDAFLEILSPETYKGNANSNSIAGWVKYKKTSFLFTADIQEEGQKNIIEKYPFVKTSNCVQIPHHGGILSEDFVKSLSPEYFIISTGENKYNKPYMDKLENISSKILRTDINGTIIIESDGEEVRLVDK